ncbi:hypothetical protein pEaSNUABM46_00180 [Erwinia phage pEa_SNUABM_46]|nr:hypothetical protein pEaSNUABM45_00180 [Erwinia phage pEa_SNUABM_45]QYW04164.1 hypothetical protein pEaSNUABM46_00180 [Erwinia phage pEa_SNUABM_46]
MLNKFYQKLQVIMTMLDLYDGACDGVWGPKCIAAKRKWELMDEFEPGVPSNGLPFNGRGKLPQGFMYAHKGLDILWVKWDQERADQILAEKGALLTKQIVHEHVVGATAAVEPTVSEPAAVASSVNQNPLPSQILEVTKIEAAPAAEPVVEDEDEDEEEEINEENTSPQSEKKPQNSNWTKNRK